MPTLSGSLSAISGADEEFVVEEMFVATAGVSELQTSSPSKPVCLVDDESPGAEPDGQARLGSLVLLEGFGSSFVTSIELLSGSR